MYFSTGQTVCNVYSRTLYCNESSGIVQTFLHYSCLNSHDLHLYSWCWKVLFCITRMQCLLLFVCFFLARLSQNIPVFKNTQRSPAYTQFLTTLLEELHFKNEDLESLTRIFRVNSPPEWSVNFKLFCIS